MGVLLFHIGYIDCLASFDFGVYTTAKYQMCAQKRGDGLYLESHFSAPYALPRRSRLSLRELPQTFSFIPLLQVMHSVGASS